MMNIRVNAIALAAMLLAPAGLAGGASGIHTTVFARAMQPGEVVRLDVTCDCEATGGSATVFGAQARLFAAPEPGVWRALIGVDLDTRPGIYKIQIVVNRSAQPPLTTVHELSVAAKRFPTRTVRVAPQFVNPPAAEMKRIEDEASRLRTLFETRTVGVSIRAFQTPLSGKATGDFGERSVFNGQPRSPHAGVDFHGEIGAPIAAPASGVVALAEPLFFTGNTVVIDHGFGLYSLLAHMSKLGVNAGDSVRSGQIVGFVGATGRVTGPHLHWSVRLNGARVDPLSLIAATDESAEKPAK